MVELTSSTLTCTVGNMSATLTDLPVELFDAIIDELPIAPHHGLDYL